MSGNETKKYIIKYHPNLEGDGGGYGVHYKRDGQRIDGIRQWSKLKRA